MATVEAMDTARLTQAVKAASAQLSNAAYYIEHRDDPGIVAKLAENGDELADWVAPLIRLADRWLEDVPRSTAELVTILEHR